MKNLKEVCEGIKPTKKTRLTKDIQKELEFVQMPRKSFMGYRPTLKISLNTANYIMSNFEEDDDTIGTWLGINEMRHTYIAVDFKNKKWRELHGQEVEVAGGCYD
jgi:hypothetical protein